MEQSLSLIHISLDYDFATEKQYSYEGLSVERCVKHLAKFASDIWQIHPFCEGNTRATAVFIIKYMKTFGFKEVFGKMCIRDRANTLRGIYGTDVLIATGNSFTGNVLKAGYTEKMAGDMIMPNGLSAYSSKMSGAELKETVKSFVEGYQGGFIPFNRGSLPVLSGISVEVKETEDGCRPVSYTHLDVYKRQELLDILIL